MRDICYVIENMIAELEDIFYQAGLEKNREVIDFVNRYIARLQEIHNRAKITAPEAILLRWQELDNMVVVFLNRAKEYKIGESSFISKYLEKVE